MTGRGHWQPSNVQEMGRQDNSVISGEVPQIQSTVAHPLFSSGQHNVMFIHFVYVKDLTVTQDLFQVSNCFYFPHTLFILALKHPSCCFIVHRISGHPKTAPEKNQKHWSVNMGPVILIFYVMFCCEQTKNHCFATTNGILFHLGSSTMFVS